MEKHTSDSMQCGRSHKKYKLPSQAAAYLEISEVVLEELTVFPFAFLSSQFCEVSIWLLSLSLYFILYFG